MKWDYCSLCLIKYFILFYVIFIYFSFLFCFIQSFFSFYFCIFYFISFSCFLLDFPMLFLQGCAKILKQGATEAFRRKFRKGCETPTKFRNPCEISQGHQLCDFLPRSCESELAIFSALLDSKPVVSQVLVFLPPFIAPQPFTSPISFK